jgi:hypothetical protein
MLLVADALDVCLDVREVLAHLPQMLGGRDGVAREALEQVVKDGVLREQIKHCSWL